jgi:hypothetical protein
MFYVVVAVVNARNVSCLQALSPADVYIDFKQYSSVEQSLTYPKKLTQSVGPAVIILENVMLGVCHLDLVKIHVTDAIKENNDVDRLGLG